MSNSPLHISLQTAWKGRPSSFVTKLVNQTKCHSWRPIYIQPHLNMSTNHRQGVSVDPDIGGDILMHEEQFIMKTRIFKLKKGPC